MDGKRDRAAADFAKAAQLAPDDQKIAAMHKRFMPQATGGNFSAGR